MQVQVIVLKIGTTNERYMTNNDIVSDSSDNKQDTIMFIQVTDQIQWHWLMMVIIIMVMVVRGNDNNTNTTFGNNSTFIILYSIVVYQLPHYV